MTWSCFVPGHPVPQPRYTQGKGGAAFIKPPKGHKVHPVIAWRQAIVLHAKRSDCGVRIPLDGPLRLIVRLRMPRPKGHYGTGKNRRKILPSAPTWYDGAGDLGNFVKAIEDALQDAGVVHNDKQIKAYGDSWIAYAHSDHGASIVLETLD